MERSDLYIVTLVLFLIGFWLHIPYGGGHIYSDIPTVFQQRECGGACLTIPYVNGFIEYPVIVSEFIYAMGAIANVLPGPVLNDYYLLTVAFLAVPTFLLVRETSKIAEMRGLSNGRVAAYLVATPTFLVMLLLNWYAIGVYFATFGLRKFMQGNYRMSGVLFGLSAASNLVTAAPAMGLFLAAKGLRNRAVFVVSAIACYGATNLPFIIGNPSLWLSFWQYHAGWYIEGSWMLAFLSSLSSLRHYIFPALLLSLYAALSWIAVRKSKDAVTLSWLSTFAFLFSTYVFTPQMNLILLPFFAIAPIVKRYWEFLAFDLVNSLFVILAFSQPLLIFGVTYQFDVVSYLAPVRWLAIVRSIWLGKMLVVDGFMPLVNWRSRIHLDMSIAHLRARIRLGHTPSSA
ncbi:MAG TPA: hypothetical protein VMS77_01650 [Conexivisphaerales archaeon]|nr:hypothetical protein [Conexivisphaerales archaeon]